MENNNIITIGIHYKFQTTMIFNWKLTKIDPFVIALVLLVINCKSLNDNNNMVVKLYILQEVTA